MTTDIILIVIKTSLLNQLPIISILIHWSPLDSVLSEESQFVHHCSVTVILSQGHCLSFDPLVNIQHLAPGHSQEQHTSEPWIIWSHWAHTHESIYTRCVWWHVWERLRVMPQESHINKCQLCWVGLRAYLMQCLNRGPQHQPSAHIKALDCWELSLDCDRQEVVILSLSNAEQRWRSSRQKPLKGKIICHFTTSSCVWILPIIFSYVWYDFDMRRDGTIIKNVKLCDTSLVYAQVMINVMPHVLLHDVGSWYKFFLHQRFWAKVLGDEIFMYQSWMWFYITRAWQNI